MQLYSAYLAVNLILARQEGFPGRFTISIGAIGATVTIGLARIVIIGFLTVCRALCVFCHMWEKDVLTIAVHPEGSRSHTANETEG